MFDESKMRAFGMMLARQAMRTAVAEGAAANEVIDLAPLLQASTADVPSPWANYHGTDAAHVLPYVQPTGAHDAYMAGGYAAFGDAVYRCTADGTVHDPAALLNTREVITE